MSEPEEIEQAPLFDQTDIHDLLLAEDEPCISIYVTTRPESDERTRTAYSTRTVSRTSLPPWNSGTWTNTSAGI